MNPLPEKICCANEATFDFFTKMTYLKIPLWCNLWIKNYLIFWKLAPSLQFTRISGHQFKIAINFFLIWVKSFFHVSDGEGAVRAFGFQGSSEASNRPPSFTTRPPRANCFCSICFSKRRWKLPGPIQRHQIFGKCN